MLRRKHKRKETFAPTFYVGSLVEGRLEPLTVGSMRKNLTTKQRAVCSQILLGWSCTPTSFTPTSCSTSTCSEGSHQHSLTPRVGAVAKTIALPSAWCQVDRQRGCRGNGHENGTEPKTLALDTGARSSGLDIHC